MSRGNPPRPVADRFWGKVNKSAVQGECWLWTGNKMKTGYGYMTIGSKSDGSNKKITAHRLSYLVHFGEIPSSDLDLCHRCDVRHCVNPSHLFVGTRTDNMRDAQAKGRIAGQMKTHCKHGHEFTPDNIYTARGRHRHCKTCSLKRAKERNSKTKGMAAHV